MKIVFTIENELLYKTDLSKKEWNKMTQRERRNYLDELLNTQDPLDVNVLGRQINSLVYIDGDAYDIDDDYHD